MAAFASQGSAAVLAVCDSSQGKAYYLSPQETGWIDDGVSTGSLTFLADEQGDANILVKDATGKTYDIKSDGATVILNGLNAERMTFTMTAIYKSTPVVEVYQISRRLNGSRQLLWTTSKNGVGSLNTVKVSAFVANCKDEGN